MKQAVSKIETMKTTYEHVPPEVKTKQSKNTEKSQLQKLKETNLFNRFLEASCDCV